MKRLSLAWPVLAGDTAADMFVYVTLGWLAVQTGDVSASAVLAANLAPALVLMLVGGAVADRLGVVRVATWTTVTRAVVLAGFALLVAAGMTDAVTLVVIALLLGIIDAVHQPAVYGLVAILAERGLQRSSQAMVVGITRTVGVGASVAGGVLIGRSLELPLVAAAGCLVIAAVCAVRVHRLVGSHGSSDDDADDEPTSLWSMTLEGLAAVRGDRAVVAVLLLLTVSNFAATAPLSLGIAFMAKEYGWDGSEYGLVYAGFGVGQVLGGLTLVGLTRRGLVQEGRLGLGAGAGLMLPASVCLVVLGMSSTPAVAGPAIAGMGLFLASAAAILMGFVRERTPSRLQGRINGLLALSIQASIPLGMLLFGVLVQTADVGIAIVAAGATQAAAAVAAAASVIFSRSSNDRRESSLGTRSR